MGLVSFELVPEGLNVVVIALTELVLDEPEALVVTDVALLVAEELPLVEVELVVIGLVKLIDNEFVLVELGAEEVVGAAEMIPVVPKMAAASEWSESAPCCETAAQVFPVVFYTSLATS